MAEPKEKKGIQIETDFNTSVPNYMFRLDWGKQGRKPSVDVMLCYMWLTDKVTSTCEGADGTPMGRVLDGLPIGCALIANEDNLNISWSSVRRNMQWLEKAGVISRTRSTTKDKYSYEIVNCRKQFNGKQSDGTIRRDGRTFTEKIKAGIQCSQCQESYANDVLFEAHPCWANDPETGI